MNVEPQASEEQKNSNFTHNYANFCILSMKQVTGTILFSSLLLMITNAHVKFQPNQISSFQDKVEQTDKHNIL